MNNNPLITIEFDIPDEGKTQFIINDKGPADLNYIHPNARTSNESFEYSGRHDQGALPTLKSTGTLANVIAALREAKSVSDGFLSERINIAYGYSGKSHALEKSDEAAIKRVRVEDDPNEEPMEIGDS